MTAVFAIFTFVPSIGLVFILIGTFPFLALAIPKTINLNMGVTCSRAFWVFW